LSPNVVSIVRRVLAIVGALAIGGSWVWASVETTREYGPSEYGPEPLITVGIVLFAVAPLVLVGVTPFRKGTQRASQEYLELAVVIVIIAVNIWGHVAARTSLQSTAGLYALDASLASWIGLGFVAYMRRRQYLGIPPNPVP
jgi:hypothetical protein